jgi:hypothetical protein
MARKQRRIKEGPPEEKWNSFRGTGITAKKGKDALALRESIGRGEFAIVKLFGGCWTSSPMKVIEEIKTSNLDEAKKHFDTAAKRLGFKAQAVRTLFA